jgi:hypothetical protein
MVVLAGCSLVRFGYNHGETLSYWWLNTYVDVDNDQQPWVKNDIDRLFAWQRKTQLKDYSQFMARTQQQLSRPVTQADALAYYGELKKRAWIIVEQALPDLADLALSLSPQQIANIERKFAANNDEYRKDNLHRDLDHRQKYRFKKVMQYAEYWFGGFSKAQENLIRLASDARPLNNELVMEARLRRQRDLIALLKKIQAEKPNRDATIAMLRKYAQALFDGSADGERQPFFDTQRDAACNLAAVIVNLTTPAQKAHAVKVLQKWMDSFAAQMAKPA